MSDNQNINDALQRQAEAWAEYKSTNDANLAQRDALNDEKLARIESTLNGINDAFAAQARAASGPISGEAESRAEPMPGQELRNYVLHGLNTRAVTTTKGADAAAIGAAGGYGVPELFDSAIVQKSVDVSPLLAEVTVKKTATPDVKIHSNVRGTMSAWVDETGTNGMYGETATPQLRETPVPFGNLFAKPLISVFSLNDIYFDVEAFVTENVSLEFAKQVGAAILNGSGVGQPHGILNRTTAATDDGVRDWGVIQHVATGVAAGLGTGAAASDKIIDLVHKLRAGHRQNAKFVMNRTTLGEVRKLKDGQGNYLWQPSFEKGQPGTVSNYSVVEAEDMPNIGAGATPILFADLAEYRLYDLVGMTMLRDPYSYDAYIALKTMKRFGGELGNSDAVKVLKCQA